MKLVEAFSLKPVSGQIAIADALLCSIGLAAFAILIEYPFPVKAVAFIPLAMAAFMISRNLYSTEAVRFYSVKNAFGLKQFVYYGIGLLMGVASATYYRGCFGMPVFPAAFRMFVLVAICIGIMEELVFRGFIQGRLSRLNPGFAIVFAAIAHATYKACLFISPPVTYHFSVFLFYTWSLGAFILIGLLRYYSKSILPAIIVHAVFDLLVYAESLEAPWWVW